MEIDHDLNPDTPHMTEYLERTKKFFLFLQNAGADDNPVTDSIHEEPATALDPSAAS